MDASEWKKRSARLHLYGSNSGLKTYFHVRQLLVLWDFLLLQEIMEVPGHRGCWMETLGSDCWHRSIVEPTQTRRAAANGQTSKDITYHDLTFILYRLCRNIQAFLMMDQPSPFFCPYIYIYKSPERKSCNPIGSWTSRNGAADLWFAGHLLQVETPVI